MIAIEALHAHYGDSHILHGINAHIAPGTCTGLLGRNGMGKTTLIRTLMGYIRPSGGSIRAGGINVTGWPPERMARLGIGYVPEGRGIFPNLTVHENLIMTARPGIDGTRHWTLERVLDTFPRLAERIHKGGGQLSGGEQQMLAIGRALLTNPRLLILDEATEGLAPLIVADIWRVIETIAQSGIATFMVDRDWQRVLRHSQQALVLEKGRVVLAGASADLLADRDSVGRYLGV